MENAELLELPVEEIIPYENNPRHNEQAVEAVAESIRQCGYVAPIIVDENNVILAGHTRLQAVKRLGYDTVPVMVRTGLTAAQKRKYRILDNKTAEYAEWDLSKLEIELEGLDFDGFDFGFDIDAPGEYEPEEERTGSLRDRYLVPPFSVVYGNKPDWLARKRAWVNFGIRSEIGRGGGLVFQFPEWMARQSPVKGGAI